MNDWTSGYVADIAYTYGYYQELQPQRLKLAFLQAGLSPPTVVNACELGFGQGLSVNVHAASSNIHWWGTDFSPAQAAFARELATVSGSDARLYDESFEEFCGRADLPEFDFIGLHGVWSWISDDNRERLTDFFRRKLRPGGVVYVSYNTLPGWAAMLPVRHLMARHAQLAAGTGEPMMKRVDNALDFAERLMALKPAYERAAPHVGTRISELRKQNRQYLAHEYFNRDWQPMHFLDAADWLQRAKLDYACSAHFHDHIGPINFTPPQEAFINTLPDRMLREAVRDFVDNTQFRRDYWVKGARPISPGEAQDEMRKLEVVLVSAVEDISLTIKTPQGEASLNAGIYGAVLEALAGHEPLAIGRLEERLAERKKANPRQTRQAVLVLAGMGHLQLAQPAAEADAAKPRCDKLNRALIDRARVDAEVSFLACPVTGAALPVPRFHQLFLLVRSQGAASAEEMAGAVWTVVQAQGQRLLREGKPVGTDQECLAFLAEEAQRFLRKALPLLDRLRVT
jgi:SAM-dependent methyltransferase